MREAQTVDCNDYYHVYIPKKWKTEGWKGD